MTLYPGFDPLSGFVISHDVRALLHPLTANPGGNSAYRSLSCYANYSNYHYSLGQGPVPNNGVIDHFPQMKGPVGPGAFDPTSDWMTEKAGLWNVYNAQRGQGVNLSDDESAYNGGYGVGEAAWTKLLERVYDDAQNQARKIDTGVNCPCKNVDIWFVYESILPQLGKPAEISWIDDYFQLANQHQVVDPTGWISGARFHAPKYTTR